MPFLERAKKGWRLVREFVAKLERDNIPILAAARAFYTGLSLAPMIVLALWFGGMMGPEAQLGIQEEIQELIGPEGGRAIELIAQNAAERPRLGNLAGLASLFVVLYAATRVFNHIQHSLNRIWGVHVDPRRKWWGWLRKRLLSVAMIATIGLLLLFSLLLSAGLAFLSDSAKSSFPDAAWLWNLSSTLASLIVFTLIFGAIFHLLPDVRIPWRDVWFGAAVTAALFVAGKFVIGMYLGRSTLSSAYGAAGALIVLLIWVYYSSLTMFFGAELTHAWAMRHGTKVEAEEHAELDVRG